VTIRFSGTTDHAGIRHITCLLNHTPQEQVLRTQDDRDDFVPLPIQKKTTTKWAMKIDPTKSPVRISGELGC
jgi:hypothetical protein